MTPEKSPTQIEFELGEKLLNQRIVEYQATLDPNPDWHTVSGHFTDKDAELYERWAMCVHDGETIVELGVEYGRSTAAMLHFLRKYKKFNVKFYSVDIWGPHPRFAMCYESLRPHIEAFTLARIREGVVLSTDMQSPVNLVPLDSSIFSLCFTNTKIAYVFLDTLHTYKEVSKSIDLWWDKVKIGGEMGFHDYAIPRWTGVVTAIDQKFTYIEPTFRSGVCISFRKNVA